MPPASAASCVPACPPAAPERGGVEIALILLLVALVAYMVASPLRSDRVVDEEAESVERAELETARDAKYREIRDAELDHRTGKLSREDWRAQDRSLRREAMELLRRLDDLDGRAADAAEAEPAPR